MIKTYHFQFYRQHENIAKENSFIQTDLEKFPSVVLCILLILNSWCVVLLAHDNGTNHFHLSSVRDNFLIRRACFVRRASKVSLW